jgi:hypothetical protein
MPVYPSGAEPLIVITKIIFLDRTGLPSDQSEHIKVSSNCRYTAKLYQKTEFLPACVFLFEQLAFF